MAYIIHYDIAALLIVITVSLHFIFKKSIVTWQTRVFSVLIVLSLISAVADIISIFTISYPSIAPIWAHYLINMVYLISFNGTSAIYFAYISLQTDGNKRLGKKDRIFFAIPYGIDIILIATTPITKLIFYINENGEYIHGPAFPILYIFAFYYVIFALIKTITFAKQLTKSQVVCTMFYTIASLLGLVAQVIYSPLLIVEFVVALAVLLIYLTMENPVDYMDKRLGTYNNLAFSEVFQLLVDMDKPFCLLGINIDGIKFVDEKLSRNSGAKILKEIADFLLTESGKMQVFFLSGTTFVIAGNDSMSAWNPLIEKIDQKFEKPFLVDDLELLLKVSMCMMTYPNTIGTIEDAMNLIEYSFGEGKSLNGSNIIYADKTLLEKGKRETQIIEILQQAITENKFEVYYQPIYSVSKNRISTAEALVRLQSSELGYISPEEFIPIAERNGLIIDIGNKVFESVCNFFKENKLQDKGIEYIHVNLSVVECMQEHLYDKLISVIDSCGIERKYISLEITETAAVVSSNNLQRNMEKLIEAGCRFAMDDYGMGFSNTSTLINYPFAEIKIDKSMVWSAMDNEKALVALKHSISMIKDLQMLIVAEGVETEEQVKMLTELGCDFFQGYYYSEPISGDALLEKL